MSKFNKKKKGELPAVNTASLPDIVFMLLFFFMVATGVYFVHDSSLKASYNMQMMIYQISLNILSYKLK